MRYDLYICLRVYPGISKKPAFWSTNKKALVTAMLRSLVASVGRLRIGLHVILDGCSEEYVQLIKQEAGSLVVAIDRENSIGNKATFSKQIKILCAQNDAHYVMFAEDDYFYRENALERTLEFLKTQSANAFATPYDHFENHQSVYGKYINKKTVHDDVIWCSTPATTLTFLCNKSCLVKYKNVFSSYTYGNFDTSIWFALTGKRAFHPFSMWSKNRCLYFKIWAKTWIYTSFYSLNSPKCDLWVPRPGLATHLETGTLSPGVDWNDLHQKVGTL